jgi:uncharacterized membrane protein
MHIFSVLVWLGGLLFQSAVLLPVFQSHEERFTSLIREIEKRFTGFMWMSVWTMLVTGILMMLLNQHFFWFRFSDRWSVLLGLKQLIFLLMVLYAFGYTRMLHYLGTPSSNGGFNEKAVIYRERINLFRRISIALGITAMLLGAAM